MNIVGWERAFAPVDLDSSQEDDKDNSAEVEQFAPPAKIAKAGSSKFTASKPTASATTKPAAAASATLAMGNFSGLLRDLIDAVKENTRAIEVHNEVQLLNQSCQPVGDNIQVLNLDELQFASIVNNLQEGEAEDVVQQEFVEASVLDNNGPENFPDIE